MASIEISLLSMSNLYNYSLRNQLLILSQCKNASVVKGMKSWNYLKRKVLPGEKSIKIIAPVKYKQKVENAKGDEEPETIEKLGYRIAYVFDISQTDGEPINQFECNNQIVVDNYDLIRTSLESVLKDYNFHYYNIHESGVEGYCNYKNKIIAVRESLSAEKKVATLIHEIAHALSNEIQSDIKSNKQMKEVEAESVALVVSNRLGLDTSDLNLTYIHNWADEDIEKFRDNLDRVRSISYSILSNIEPKLQTYLKEKELNKTKNNNKEKSVCQIG